MYNMYNVYGFRGGGDEAGPKLSFPNKYFFTSGKEKKTKNDPKIGVLVSRWRFAKFEKTFSPIYFSYNENPVRLSKF